MSNVINFSNAKIEKELRAEIVAYINSGALGDELFKLRLAELVEQFDKKNR